MYPWKHGLTQVINYTIKAKLEQYRVGSNNGFRVESTAQPTCGYVVVLSKIIFFL
jgi:hypothetical protein